MVRNSLEWLAIAEVVVKVYIAEGEFFQIAIEFVEMLCSVFNFSASSSSTSSSNGSSYLVFVDRGYYLSLI